MPEGYDPTLALVTAAIEVGAAVWTLRGPGRKPILYTTGSILFFLAAYQIIEAIFCTGNPATLGFLPRLAFMVVAWLPPMGLLLVAHLYPTRTRTLFWYAYGMFLACLGLVTGIAMDGTFVSASVCLVVFARYTTLTPLYQSYGIFYQAGLISMLLLSAYGTTICQDEHRRLLLGQVLLGSIAFIVPSLFTVAVIPVADNALPSIMCHFALLLALFLIRLVVLERRAVAEGSGQMTERARGMA
ncbi:MAG: hypothetical protein JXB85_04455 [Anaerolineales bacterium]|nr:hypothetical protein [Anaerolineales bacterium]